MPVLSDLLASERGLYDRMTTAARRACRKFARDSADLDDMLASAWSRALDKQNTIRSPEKLIAWFVSLARNECLAIVEKRRREGEQEAKLAYHLQTWGAGDETPVLSQEFADGVISLEIALPPEQRKIFHCHAVSGKSFKWIATEYGITESAARKRFQRAREGMREAYDKLVAVYADRDEPEDPPLAVRVTTERRMRGIIAAT
jgi:RNA polymerase sigma factor (sigma-70 family)